MGAMTRSATIRSCPRNRQRTVRISCTPGSNGVPFALLWQFYDNDVLAGGSHNGFWMIDDQGWHRAYKVPEPLAINIAVSWTT